MPAPPRAVFLSYASQDAEVARAIAGALREDGIVVWLDQTELRGGDAWDAQIRRRIDTCTLFVPIISTHTEGRREGYFRFEWRLAEERHRRMALETPFLVPVACDGVVERNARVPRAFLDVHWARVTRGTAVDPALVEHVRAQLAAGTLRGETLMHVLRPADAPTPAPGDRSLVAWMPVPSDRARPGGASGPAASEASDLEQRVSRRFIWLQVAIGLGFVAALLWYWWRS